MKTIYSLIQGKAHAWVRLEEENNRSLIKSTMQHIKQAGKLRTPQREAIEIYLWIKFVGENKPLAQMVEEGLLYDDSTAQCDYSNVFNGNYVTLFLNQFFQENNLKILHQKLLKDSLGESTDWDAVLRDLLHNFDYANYLFSLPMGAGKTFLMACFIYLDLYFASLFKHDKRFAHNFVIFAPHSSKTAILPSLRTIKDFDPEWILPPSDANKLKQNITIEVLDRLSSARRDKLHGNNPNLEKVNRMRQTNNFGMVFITNAEKVVVGSYKIEDIAIIRDGKIGQKDSLDDRKINDIKKTNDLREALSLIPNLGVILDEVHHSMGTTKDGDKKKLRQAVDILNQHQNVNSVIGFSGTPYVKTKVNIGTETIILNQIQDIVYHYPLNIGIGDFLKRPNIRKADINESAFIQQALSEFFLDYDIDYADGTQSKVAIYCPSIKTLNEEILPAVQSWYAENRRGKEDEIFRYYSKVTKENKQYALPKESLAIFNNLDRSHSKKRIILLVAIGTEGWDCRSLTSVILPRQKTSKNFVLQTTCRCLREVENAQYEKALVYLSPDNYETLDKELQENYQLSISDLSQKGEQNIEIQVRKPRLGVLKYKQIETKYKIIQQISPDIQAEFSRFKMSAIQNKFPYQEDTLSAQIGASGLVGEFKGDSYNAGKMESMQPPNFSDFIYVLADSSYGLFSESELTRYYNRELIKIHKGIQSQWNWLLPHPQLNLEYVVRYIVAMCMKSIEYSREIIEKETEIELLEWQGTDNTLPFLSSQGSAYRSMPKISEDNFKGNRGYGKHPEYMEEDFFSEGKQDPQDISYNYIPYKMDSEFEQNALTEMLKLSELKNLEVYFNGYRDNRLQSFWIQTPSGRYTPDFLILKRRDNEKYNKNKRIVIEKVLIVETKGRPYYDDDFKAKERFIQDEFLHHNQHFKYHCFIDDGGNNFSIKTSELKKIVQGFLQ